MLTALRDGRARAAAAFQSLNDNTLAALEKLERQEPSDETAIGYKLALIQFQHDQVAITKEYQKLVGEKDLELARIAELYEKETGKTLELWSNFKDTKLQYPGSPATPVGTQAYDGMTHCELKAQVQVLLDSVRSWEEKVNQLLSEKADAAARAALMNEQLKATQSRTGDLIDRIKLQQSEIQKWVTQTKETKSLSGKDAQKMESLESEYTQLISEYGQREEQDRRHIRELENTNDELLTKLAAYERNILQLIDTQTEIAKQERGTILGAAAVEQLQQALQDKENEIRRLMSASSAHVSSPGRTTARPFAQTNGMIAEVETLRQELEEAHNALELADKVPSALREEITELQAKLEAAYKTASRHNGSVERIKELESQLTAAQLSAEEGASCAEDMRKRLQQEHRAASEALEGRHSEYLKAQRAEWERETSRLRSEHSEDLRQKEAALEALRQELQIAQKANLVEADKARIEALAKTESDRASALEALRKELTTASAVKEARLQQDMEMITSELQGKITGIEKQKEEALSTLNQVEKSLEDKLQAMRIAHIRELQRTKQEAAEEAQAESARAVEAAKKEVSEALSLYSEESRKRKQLNNRLLELQGNIRVICRVRPLIPLELAAGEATGVADIPTAEDIIIKRDSNIRSRFEFDKIFGPTTSQEEVFASVSALCTSLLDGYSCTLMAYGQTGAGKTHTMDYVNLHSLKQIFHLLEERKHYFTYDLQLSCLEVYNEQIRDLLGSAVKGSLPTLDIRLGQDGTYDVPGLTLKNVDSLAQVLILMKVGTENRAVGAHDMNEHSSRSHSIVTMRIRGENLHDKSVVQAKLHLVDLAGSERLSKTDATGERLKEAQNINKSLSALGDVIAALSSKNKTHVPFRNSKLTFLLQDSLSGDSKVVMFMNVSPAPSNVKETLTTLTFGLRCRQVQLGAPKKDATSAELIELREKVDQLERELAQRIKAVPPTGARRASGIQSTAG